MDLTNPFGRTDMGVKKEQQIRQHQEQYERDTVVTESSVHLQSKDDDIWLQKNQELSEIRRWLLDQTEKFQHAFEELSARRFNDQGEPVEIPYVKPLVDIAGAYHLINFVKIHDQNVMRSNYTEQRINLNLRYGVGYPLVQLIKSLAKRGLVRRDKAAMDYLVQYCFNLTEPTYYHALLDGERKHESQIHKVVETKNVMPNEAKKGWFS